MMSIGPRIHGLCNEMNFLLLKYRPFLGCLILMYGSVVFSLMIAAFVVLVVFPVLSWMENVMVLHLVVV